MTVPLIVVDSKNKERTIRDQLAARAEIMTLEAPPMKIGRAGTPRGEKVDDALAVEPLPGQEEFCRNLTGPAERDILVAFDSDQRGDFWSWMIDKFMRDRTDGARRVKCLQPAGFERELLEEAMLTATPVHAGRGESYYVRSLFNAALTRHIKRVLGTASGPGDLPLNYFSLTAIFLLVEREEQGKIMPGGKRWRLRAEMYTPGAAFSAKLVSVAALAEDGILRDAGGGREVAALLKDAPVRITGVEREEFVLAPPLPYRFPELLQEACILFGLQPSQVLDALRLLSEGVAVNGRRVGLISTCPAVPRPDKGRLLVRLRSMMELAGGDDVGTDDDAGFEPDCIVPLRPGIAPEDLEGLDEAGRQVYGLVRARALASQMAAATGETLTLIIAAGDRCVFSATGHVLAEEGFLATHYGHRYQELLRPLAGDAVQEGMSVSIRQVVPEQEASLAAGYYTFDELFADFADFGLVTDPVTVMMLQSMFNRQYVAFGNAATMMPLDNARMVAGALRRAFPGMAGLNLSAYFAQTVEEVLSGRKTLDKALLQFEQTLVRQGRELAVPGKRPPDKVAAPEPSDRTFKPAEAGAELSAAEEALSVREAEPAAESVPAPAVAEITGRAEPAAGTAGEPAAVFGETGGSEAPGEAGNNLAELESSVRSTVQAGDGTAGVVAGLEMADNAVQEDVEIGAEPVASAAEKIFASPSGELAIVAPAAPVQKEAPVLACPLCGGAVLARKTPTGRSFYVCQAAECEFMAWSLPHAIPCELCGSPFLVEKKSSAGNMVLRCPRAGCDYRRPFFDEQGSGAAEAEAGQARRLVRVRRVGAGASGAGVKRRVVRVARKK